MFTNFFKALKRRGVPVTFNEWLLLQNALSKNLMDSSLMRFYHLARAILIKTEAHFDKYDQAFLECFGHIESTEELARAFEERLRQVPALELTEEEKRMVEELSLEEVRANFEARLRDQDDEEHIGGNRAIGIRGRSTQGAWGYNPAGVRIGQGVSRHNRAIQIAEKRSFKNYRDDLTLDTRSMKTVLHYIRQVVREGPKEVLDVDGTIDKTCRNAGELELIWERARRKRIKLMLLMDAGENPSKFFGEHVLTGSHDRSLQAVVDGFVDGAAVHGIVYNQIVAEDPSILQKVRVLAKSAPFGIPPIVAHPDLDPILKKDIVSVLLRMHEDAEGKSILAKLQIERFVVPDRNLFAPLRLAISKLEKWR